jgi:CRP-like cAMP-binding protein
MALFPKGQYGATVSLISYCNDAMRFLPKNSANPTIERLKEIPVFRGLSHREILKLNDLLHERTFAKDEIVFEEGDVGHGVFIIVSGKVRARSSRKLLEQASFEFGPGDLVGELCLFDESPRNATVVAVERTVAVALFQAEFSSLLMMNKNIGVKVLVEISKTLSQRVRQLLLQETNQPSV